MDQRVSRATIDIETKAQEGLKLCKLYWELGARATITIVTAIKCHCMRFFTDREFLKSREIYKYRRLNRWKYIYKLD